MHTTSDCPHLLSSDVQLTSHGHHHLQNFLRTAGSMAAMFIWQQNLIVHNQLFIFNPWFYQFWYYRYKYILTDHRPGKHYNHHKKPNHKIYWALPCQKHQPANQHCNSQRKYAVSQHAQALKERTTNNTHPQIISITEWYKTHLIAQMPHRFDGLLPPSSYPIYTFILMVI